MISVIVVDDDTDNLELFSELLELHGIQVLDKVTNGKDALSSYESLKPDVVFLDVMMPEHDGLSALENIRKLNPSAHVIMVTADTSIETEQMLKKLKPSAVIIKPYNMTTIINILETDLHLTVSEK